MNRENRLVRLFRAVTDATQQELSDAIGIHRVTLTQYEGGKIPPAPDHLERLASYAGLTIAEGDEILQHYETLRQTRLRSGRAPEDLFATLGEPLRSRAHRAFQRLLRLPLPDAPPRAEDRVHARDLFANLEKLTPEQRLAVVRIATEYQTWAVCELAVERSLVGEGEAWAELAVEISEYVGGTKEWKNRVRGYALAAKAKALIGVGKKREAEVVSKEARKLWGAGVDVAGLLAGGRVGVGLEG